MLLHHPSYIESWKALFGLALKKILQKFNQIYLIKKANNVLEKCVVPENIQTPTTEGISFRTPPPPPPRIFHFCRELMTPHPLGISTSVTNTPQPLWKSLFSRRKTIKEEEWGHLWLVRNGFHQKLVYFCFHLLEWSRNIKTHYTTTK